MCSRRFMTVGVVVAAGLILAVAYGGAVVSADNAWANYHWARTTASFDLIVVDSTTDDWGVPFVRDAVDDWSYSTVLNMVQEPGPTSKKIPRRRVQGSLWHGAYL